MGFNVAMVCDFFYPQLGGVEFHIYHLAQNLIDLGHSVIIITHAYGNRTGIRHLTNGLKVYHIPLFILHRETTFPSVFYTFFMVRNILIRENIQILHAHSSASAMGMESICHANALGIRTVFTDHSLYGFSVLGSILLNKLLKYTLANVDRVICVSNICKENMIVRADIEPEKLSVIPNAVVNKDFAPLDVAKSARRSRDRITIVVISRLFPNKGCDLLLRILPTICRDHDDVDFIMAGDGPRFIDFQQMIEAHRLQDRVSLLGAVAHERIRDILCRGDVYLHASLTEAFGTVLVEAASCGLLIVTTKVGGIPEVLPEHMTVFADRTSVSSLIEATQRAIDLIRSGQVNTSSFHHEVAQMYDWRDVARRTDIVYHAIYNDSSPHDKDWLLMIKKLYRRKGIWARHLYVLCAIVEYCLILIFDFLYPRDEIDRAPKWPTREEYLKRIQSVER